MITSFKIKNLMRWLIIGITPIILFCIVISHNSNIAIQNGISKKLNNLLPENSKDRAKYEMDRRGGVMDIAKMREANITYKNLLGKTKKDKELRDGGLESWTALGPSNIGGKVVSVATHPTNSNIIFIGTTGSGMYKSTNNGSTWSSVFASNSGAVITSITIDPNNTNTMYITTGEYSLLGSSWPGNGAYKSTDGGQTFYLIDEALNNPIGSPWITEIIIDPNNSDVLYMIGSNCELITGSDCASDGYLLRSTDAGVTWNEEYLYNAFSANNNITDIDINPNNSLEIIIGTYYDALKSTDAGQTFSSFIGSSPLITTANGFTGLRCEVEYCSNGDIYVSRFLLDFSTTTYRTELWNSTNGGNNWTKLFDRESQSSTSNASYINPLNTQGHYSHVLWADPTDCSRVLLGGINLWKWENNSLIRISDWVDDIGSNPATGTNNSIHADFHAIEPATNYNGSSNSKMWLGNDGGIYNTNDIWSASTNAGWSAFNNDLNITQLYGADISEDGDVVIGGSQDNSYFFDYNNTDGSMTFDEFSTGDGGFCAIDKSNSDNIYTTTQNGAIYRSTDGGFSFCNLARFNSSSPFSCCVCSSLTNISDTTLFIAPFMIDPIDNNTIYIAGKQLWKSTNQGDSWTSIKPSLNENGDKITAFDVSKSDNQTIMVGHENGKAYLTTDGGNTWSQNDLNLSGNYITDIAIHPKDPTQMILSTGGYTQNNIFYTDFSGIIWQSIDFNGWAMHVSSLAWHPYEDNWIYAGTDNGIISSESLGVSWDLVTESPSFLRITELFWQPDTSVLCAATHGRGIWKSNNLFKKIYVDKNYTGTEEGSESKPFDTFREAVDFAATKGSEIIFLSSGDHDEVPPSILVEKGIKITLAGGPIILE